MADTVAPTGVAAPAAGTETKPKRSPGLINQAHARALSRAESVATSAKLTAYAPALEARDIEGEFTDTLLEDVDKGRDKAAEAVANTTAQRHAAATARREAKKLEAGLREVQIAAKQKYARSNRIAMRDFLVGRKLNGSHANLAQTSQTIINRAGSDKLPGFTAARVKALDTQRQAWLDAQAAQAEAETAAIKARAELKELVKSITDRRFVIQLAADAEWSHQEEVNGAVRKEFGLSTKRPLKV